MSCAEYVLGLMLILSAGCRPANNPERSRQLAEPAKDVFATGSAPRPLNDRKFDRTPRRLARGRYLYEAVLTCDLCHAPYEHTIRGWPPVPGKSGSGFQYATSSNPNIIAPNITPDPQSGAGAWSDDMLARAIREGVGHDGRVLDPHMPY